MGDGSCRAARAEDGCALSAGIETRVIPKGTIEAGEVGVVADQVSTIMHDRIDRADRLSSFVEAVEEGDNGLLVRDRDVGSVDVVPTKRVDSPL